jgi:hypothetical protein
VKPKSFGPAATLYETMALSFVIPSAPGFPASPLSPATTYVVLRKENHMHLTGAATLERKSGGAEGSAVLRTLPGYVFFDRAPKLLFDDRVIPIRQQLLLDLRSLRSIGKRSHLNM